MSVLLIFINFGLLKFHLVSANERPLLQSHLFPKTRQLGCRRGKHQFERQNCRSRCSCGGTGVFALGCFERCGLHRSVDLWRGLGGKHFAARRHPQRRSGHDWQQCCQHDHHPNQRQSQPQLEQLQHWRGRQRARHSTQQQRRVVEPRGGFRPQPNLWQAQRQRANPIDQPQWLGVWRFGFGDCLGIHCLDF